MASTFVCLMSGSINEWWLYSLGTSRICYFPMYHFSEITLQFFIGTKDFIRTCQELLDSAKTASHSQMEIAVNCLLWWWSTTLEKKTPPGKQGLPLVRENKSELGWPQTASLILRNPIGNTQLAYRLVMCECLHVCARLCVYILPVYVHTFVYMSKNIYDIKSQNLITQNPKTWTPQGNTEVSAEPLMLGKVEI